MNIRSWVKAWEKDNKGGIDDFINQPGYLPTIKKIAKYQDETAAGATGNVKYYMVQTEHPDSKFLTEDAGSVT